MGAGGEAPTLRKRQQIQKVGKNMFIWVAGASVILGICAVLSISLFERMTYRQSVIDAKNKTAKTLENNIATAKELKKEVKVLNTNQSLLSTPRLDDTEPITVILDALPSNANSSALGASLQQNLLNLDGVTIEALTVNPIPGVEDVGEDTSASDTAGENEITFQFTVSIASDQVSVLQEMLRKLEKSIRTINLVSVNIEQQGSKVTLSAEGKAYYQPAESVQLKDKAVPKGGNK